MADTDAELMLLVQQGDEDAFLELLTRYQKRLVNFFYHLGWDYHLSEDLAQEVFLRIYRYRKRYSHTAKFKTFLYRIAKNLWIDHLRKKKSRPAPVSLDKEVSADGDSAALRDLLHSPGSGRSQDEIQDREIGAAIDQAASELSEQERMIFLMVTRQKLKYREIAGILDIPEGTVKSKVFYIFRKLREKLKELEPDGM